MRNYLQKMKALMAVMLLNLSVVFALQAQTREVTGTVFDETRQPLPGVTVLVKGTTRGTTTDLDGKFRIGLQSGDQALSFSFVGFTTQEVTVGNQSSLTITLREDIQSLQEAVVIGYGTQDRKEITSSVASVKAEQFNRGNFVNPAQLLQGKVAGLSVTRPGGNPNAAPEIRLRGISSFGASQSPLIVIDGVIGATIDAVDPNDIESIDVLKDASAAAIYGTRGAAGVILITTKKGSSKKGFANVTINTFSTLEEATNLIPVLSPEEFVRRGGTDFGSKTNWRKEVLQSPLNQTFNASVTGGHDNTTYSASVNYRNNDGLVKGTNRETLNTRFNLNYGALNNRLRMNANASYTSTAAQDVNGEAVRYATIYNPTAPIFENGGPSTSLPFGGYFQRPLFDFFNPVALINQQKFETDVRAAILSYRAEFDVTDDWIVSVQYSQDRLNTLSSEFFSRQDYQTGFGRFGQAGQRSFERFTSILTGTARYEKEIMDGLNLAVLLGAETQSFNEKGLNAASTRFLYDAGFNNLGAGALRLGPGTDLSSFANKSKLNSTFARANFNYKNIYFLSTSIRSETFSGFGKNNQTGFFPAVSLGGDLSQAFDMGIFNQFKVRASYGVVGQLPPSPTLALGIYQNGNRIPLDPDNPNSVFVGINQTTNPNPTLKWETTTESNFGVDFGVKEGKITGSVDYWRRSISDLLYNTFVGRGVPNPFLPGTFNSADNTWVNIADFKSSGYEFVASYNNAKIGQVSWTPSLNFTIYKRARIASLGSGEITLPELRAGVPGSPGQNDNPIVWNKLGERIGDFYGPRFLGLREDGSLISSSPTNDPTEFERLGNALPRGDFGFANSFNYKQWDLNFLLRGSWGHLIYNSFRGFYENADGSSNTWNSVVTKNTPTSPFNTSTPVFTDLYLEKGDFVRLDNLQIGYNVETRGNTVSNLRLYAGVQNLFTLTNFSGVDPEVRWVDRVSPTEANPLAPGIERRNTYFLPRIWQVGLTMSFK